MVLAEIGVVINSGFLDSLSLLFGFKGKLCNIVSQMVDIYLFGRAVLVFHHNIRVLAVCNSVESGSCGKDIGRKHLLTENSVDERTFSTLELTYDSDLEMLARILGNNVADRLCRIIELERGSIFPELLQRVDQFIYGVTERGVASEIISLLFHYKPPVENSANGKTPQAVDLSDVKHRKPHRLSAPITQNRKGQIGTKSPHIYPIIYNIISYFS